MIYKTFQYLYDEYGSEFPHVVGTVIEYITVLLHPAMGVEGIGLYPEDPVGKYAIKGQEAR